jgi:hypothetical protein
MPFARSWPPRRCLSRRSRRSHFGPEDREARRSPLERGGIAGRLDDTEAHEERYAGRDARWELGDDPGAIGHGNLDEANSLLTPAPCEEGPAGRARILDPVGLAGRHQVGPVGQDEGRDRCRPEPPADAARDRQQVEAEERNPPTLKPGDDAVRSRQPPRQVDLDNGGLRVLAHRWPSSTAMRQCGRAGRRRGRVATGPRSAQASARRST